MITLQADDSDYMTCRGFAVFFKDFSLSRRNPLPSVFFFYHEFHFAQLWQRNPLTSIHVVSIPLDQGSKFDLEGWGQGAS